MIFTREMRKATRNDVATLTKSFGPYYPERPDDLFEVEFRGERMIVQRQDIRERATEKQREIEET